MTQKYPEIITPANSFKADAAADWKLSGKAVFTADNVLSFDHSGCGKTSSQACLTLNLNQTKPAQVILSAESLAECAETNNPYEYAVL